MLGHLDPHLLLLDPPGSYGAVPVVLQSAEGIHMPSELLRHSGSSTTPLASLSSLLPLNLMLLWLRLRRCSHLHRHLPQTRCLHCFHWNHLYCVLRALGLCFLGLLSEGSPPLCPLGFPCTACSPPADSFDGVPPPWQPSLPF